MEFLKKWGPAILGVVASVAGGAMSGPLGAIVGAVTVVGLVVGGILVQRAWKNFKFGKAQEQQNQQGVAGHNQVIADNQNQSVNNASALSQSEQDFEAAKKLMEEEQRKKLLLANTISPK